MLRVPLKSVQVFVGLILNESGITLTCKQIFFLGKFLTAMILLGSFKITAVSNLFLCGQSTAALYAMLRRTKIPFNDLFIGALKLMIKTFKVTKVTLQIDDTDRERSKNCKLLPFVRKAMCKATGGWIQAQNIVFIVMVTDVVTIPVWFKFHRPAKLSGAEKKKLKGNTDKIKKLDPTYKTKIDLACEGLEKVKNILSQIMKELEIDIKVQSISGDNGYASPQIQIVVTTLFDCQYISKAKPNQNVKTKTGLISLSKLFERYSVSRTVVNVRGHLISVEIKSARVFIESFGRKVFVVAIRYKDEKNWQYLFGTDLTWTAETIIKGYALRWLAEVFFEDWKQCDGWGSGALQRSDDGAVRGLFLSLLVDLFLLFYQSTDKSLQEHGRGQLYSAGTVVRHLQIKACCEAIEGILDSENPRAELERVQEQMIAIAERHISLKHAKTFGLPNLEQSSALRSRFGKLNRIEEEKQRIAINGESKKPA
ncbi:MAG: hypothetical protein EX263_13200 [Flavobacteriaceae bacterium]|nr:MAG: hypothetical protein EX263_13200 [Flavobacteriaceae bacterium]